MEDIPLQVGDLWNQLAASLAVDPVRLSDPEVVVRVRSAEQVAELEALVRANILPQLGYCQDGAES